MIAAVVAVEGIQRLVAPPVVDARLVLPVALAGIGVSLLATWQLARAQRQSLNIRGSLQHLLTDLYGFAGTALAAVVILLTGFMRADALASLVVAAVMIRTGWKLVRRRGRSCSRRHPATSTRIRWHRRCGPTHWWSTCTTSTSGRSRPGCRRCRPTCWSRPARTAMRCGGSWSTRCQHDFHVTHTTLQVDHAGGPEQVITPFRRTHAT